MPVTLPEPPLRNKTQLFVQVLPPLVELKAAKTDSVQVGPGEGPVQRPVDSLGAVALVTVLGDDGDAHDAEPVVVAVHGAALIVEVQYADGGGLGCCRSCVTWSSLVRVCELLGGRDRQADQHAQEFLADPVEDFVAASLGLWPEEARVCVGAADGVVLEAFVEPGFDLVSVWDGCVDEPLGLESCRKVTGHIVSCFLGSAELAVRTQADDLARGRKLGPELAYLSRESHPTHISMYERPLVAVLTQCTPRA